MHHCGIFEAPRFSSFSTQSANIRHADTNPTGTGKPKEKPPKRFQGLSNQLSLEVADDRCGSIASVWRCPHYFRFSPESRHLSEGSACPKSANIGLMHRSKYAASFDRLAAVELSSNQTTHFYSTKASASRLPQPLMPDFAILKCNLRMKV
jgi:hypothetical protein